MLGTYLRRNQEVSFSKVEKWCLAVITAIGAFIQVSYTYNRPFVGDEVGTLMNLEKSFAYILTHSEGWLTMNYFIALEKMMGMFCANNPLSLIAIPLLAGIAIIPLTGLLACQFSNSKVALIAATLVAANPYLTGFSGLIRAYSLLTMLSLLVIILFFRWFYSRTLKDGIAVAVASYLLMLTHPGGGYVLAYIAFIGGVDFLSRLIKRERWEVLTLGIPLGVALICVTVSYYKIYFEMSGGWNVAYHDVGPTSISYIPYIFGEYFAQGYYGWLTAFFLMASFLISYKENKPIFLLLPCVILPIILISIQGMTVVSWSYGRYLIFVVPILIIFLADFIEFLAIKVFKKGAAPWVLAITALVIATWWPNMQGVFKSKVDYPWQEAGSFIRDHYKDGDVVLCDDGFTCLNLYPYAFKPAFERLTVEEFNKKDRTIGKTFFVISQASAIDTAQSSRLFGKIQVVVYPSDIDTVVLRRLRDDIKRSTATQEIRPELAFLYRCLWVINNKLGIDDDNFRYFNLWRLSFQLTPGQQNISVALQKREYQEFIRTLGQ
ncbi:MAG: hypothetical protein HQL21_07235 [Candidatus Omnitrophica bacterium]|nr:hypothetical protein [Candidatus Omnitrophota bacterium]